MNLGIYIIIAVIAAIVVFGLIRLKTKPLKIYPNINPQTIIFYWYRNIEDKIRVSGGRCGFVPQNILDSLFANYPNGLPLWVVTELERQYNDDVSEPKNENYSEWQIEQIVQTAKDKWNIEHPDGPLA